MAIMDWASRRVLAWRLSNTLDVSFCLEALEEALKRYGPPEIFNTDHGSQFTAEAFTGLLTEPAVRNSTHGQGRWMNRRTPDAVYCDTSAATAAAGSGGALTALTCI